MAHYSSTHRYFYSSSCGLTLGGVKRLHKEVPLSRRNLSSCAISTFTMQKLMNKLQSEVDTSLVHVAQLCPRTVFRHNTRQSKVNGARVLFKKQNEGNWIHVYIRY
jgi:hypothetical protein